MSVSFGISSLPAEHEDDPAFLDALAAQGHRAFELAFTKGFPWKEDRCASFGHLAAARGISLSVHAPYSPCSPSTIRIVIGKPGQPSSTP
jgi:sugar phosphate isomerase/epimerase